MDKLESLLRTAAELHEIEPSQRILQQSELLYTDEFSENELEFVAAAAAKPDYGSFLQRVQNKSP